MKLKPLPLLITLASIACFAGAVSITMSGTEQKGPRGANQQSVSGQQGVSSTALPAKVVTQAPSVMVVEVQTDSYKALIKGFGEAMPHYELAFSAEVSGQVESLSAVFETGNIVKKGEVLARLENTSYRQAVTQAKSDLAQAKLDLLEEERMGEQARLEWTRSGLEGEPNSTLVLREPQLAAQQAVVSNAEYSLIKAEKDLEKTVIKAPFDALIVERNIQPGSYLQSGATLASLYSTDRVEVEIPLSTKQWQSLPTLSNQQLSGKEATQWPVTLYDSEGMNSWQGRVVRIEQHLDTTSRQRSLIVAVDNPFEQQIGLFPGTFVQAHIEGRTLDNTWKLPASAISQQGDIWFVSENNQLNKVPAEKYFEKADSVYVAPISELSSAQIIKRPLSSYVVGMQVTPKVEG